ncbi:uncharacterized protein LOC132050042 isoform X1 [Lycium ferocissimum]|uniref:uncharacterized protein LOC132050042 isoform X1 n=1 Tax=Lycium ferocissimum TaxID=112874 RepID=UPI00281521EF|nr:uncharacterized protein LOC132050042 isoform X1 [Lycium ferocissimum]
MFIHPLFISVPFYLSIYYINPLLLLNLFVCLINPDCLTRLKLHGTRLIISLRMMPEDTTLRVQYEDAPRKFDPRLDVNLLFFKSTFLFCSSCSHSLESPGLLKIKEDFILVSILAAKRKMSSISMLGFHHLLLRNGLQNGSHFLQLIWALDS